MQNLNQKKWGRNDTYCLFGLCALIFLYFYKILGLQIGFYSGDHRQQHYPWAFFYAEQLRLGLLPWWTSLFGCGFPLLAEGQVGALYPLNFLFYKLFPFDFAYTYNILFHYILGASFFYLFVRNLSLSIFSSFLGALIYLFGTAQGGYYYNIISLKTLVWFPLGLFFVFRIFERREYRFLFWLGLLFSFQLCAGYLQYAVYSIVFTGMTCLWLAGLDIQRRYWRGAGLGLAAAGIAVILGFICAAPQLGATLELSRFSNRFDFPIEFAFVGSVNPLAIATLFFPHWDGFLRAEIYFGAIGLLFFLHAFRHSSLKHKGYFIFGFFTAIFLALGGFNPAYRAVVDWTNFSSFRIPSKFIYFAGFYGAILCAYGAEAWFRCGADLRQKTWKIWSFLSLVSGIGLIAAHYLLRAFRGPLLDYFSIYIDEHFKNSVIRPHTLEVYQHKLVQLYDGILSATRISEPLNITFIVVIVMSWILMTYSLKKNLARNYLMGFVAIALFVNLWIFGDTSIRGSYQPKEFLLPSSKITQFLKDQKSSNRLHRVYRDIYGADALPLMPHNTILIHRPMVGAYSPLIMKSFYTRLNDLGDVNDSNALKVSTREKFISSSEFIDFLNVEWILSDHEFSFDRYKQVVADNQAFLYQNSYVRPRASLESEPSVPVLIQDNQNSVLLNFRSENPDRLIMSDLFYPGWKALLNGKPALIDKQDGLFRSVVIPSAGDWMLEMRYAPLWEKAVFPCAALAGLFFILPFFLRGRHEN